MPRSLEPGRRLTLVLACDVDKPKETQPRIFARTLTVNQARDLFRALQSMRSGDADAKMDAAIDAAEVCLTGWENMADPDTGEAIPFSRQAIGDVLSLEEMNEVFSAVTSTFEPSSGDEKKSESPPS